MPAGLELTPQNYVVDTSALISYFWDVFEVNNILSQRAIDIIGAGFDSYSNVRLTIPGMVFVEIFDKWLIHENMAAKFRYQVVSPVLEANNIEVSRLDRDTLQAVLSIRGSLSHHEIHDKIILASAKILQCPLITTDGAITQYVNQTQEIPGIIS